LIENKFEKYLDGKIFNRIFITKKSHMTKNHQKIFKINFKILNEEIVNKMNNGKWSKILKI